MRDRKAARFWDLRVRVTAMLGVMTIGALACSSPKEGPARVHTIRITTEAGTCVCKDEGGNIKTSVPRKERVEWINTLDHEVTLNFSQDMVLFDVIEARVRPGKSFGPIAILDDATPGGHEYRVDCGTTQPNPEIIVPPPGGGG